MQNSFQKIFQITENLEKNDFKIVVDSREVKKGDLFFAMKGEREDGHEYLKNAKNRGAVAAVVSKDYLGQGFGLNLIKVQCVNAFLENLAEHRLEKNKAKIVPITGSCGKTTTKDYLKVLIENYIELQNLLKIITLLLGLV